MNNNDQHIDDLVRERLKALPAPTPPQGGWAAMEQQLDGDADLRLRDALTGLATKTPPTGWESLERKLVPQTAVDQRVAEQLNGLKPAPPAGWDILAARLDLENEKDFDAIVSKGLAQTTPTATSGWAALAARLELIGWRRNTVAAWKITESCLLLSLLLLFVRFGPTTPASPTFAELTEGFPLPAHSVLGSQSFASDKPARLTNGTSATTPAELVEQNRSSGPVALLGKSIAKTTDPQSPDLATTEQSGPDVKVAPLRALTPDVVPLAEPVTSVVKISPPGLLSEETYLPDNVSMLAIDKLKTSLHPPSPALTLPEKDNTDPILYYLNVFVSPYDMNEVTTPGTEIGDIDISADQRFTYGKSAGLMLEAAQGKNSLQIGAVYAQRSYIPTALKWYLWDEFPVVEPLKGFSRFTFESVDFQLNYKRNLIETSKWRLSSRIGMSINIIAYSDFVGKDEVIEDLNNRFEDFELRATPAVDPAPSLAGRSSDRSNNTSDQKRLVDPPNGWWEGGSALENSSLYFNGGIVMERLMNQRWSVYVSPSFSRVVYLKKNEGIGPFNDRINPFGIRFGSRYHFGGK